MAAKVIPLDSRRRTPAVQRPAPPTKPCGAGVTACGKVPARFVRLRVAVRQVRAGCSTKARHRERAR